MPEDRATRAIITTAEEAVLYDTLEAVSNGIGCWYVEGVIRCYIADSDVPARRIEFTAETVAHAIMLAGTDSDEAKELRARDSGMAGVQVVRAPDHSVRKIHVIYGTEHLSMDTIQRLLQMALRRSDDPLSGGIKLEWGGRNLRQLGDAFFDYRIRQADALQRKGQQEFSYYVLGAQDIFLNELVPAFVEAKLGVGADFDWGPPGNHLLDQAIETRLIGGGFHGGVAPDSVAEAFFGPARQRRREKAEGFLNPQSN